MLQKNNCQTLFFLITSFFLSLYLIFPKTCLAEDKDLHSLRPRPGVAGENVPLVRMCGETLVFTDQIEAIYSPISTALSTCTTPDASGNITCSYNIPKTITVTIDLSETELPIMGNTEDVVNQENDLDETTELTDAQKMNEYVSWYLNGVINKAEYEFLDTTDPNDINKIINYSGPLRKLLPWDLQIYPKLKIIERVGEGDLYNQIVACVDLLGRPIPCKDSFFLNKINKRVKAWDENWLEEIISNVKGTITDYARKIFGNPADWITSVVFSWTEATPPLRENYENYKDYYVDYKEWRGRYCAKGPFNLVFCYLDIFKADYWADLFPYIPFTSTEDKEGSVEYNFVQQTSGDVEIINPSFNLNSAVFLYFPHMEEASEGADLLQFTYSPKDIEIIPIMDDIISVSDDTNCKVIESNPGAYGGDSLYPSKDKMFTFLTYTAKFECSFNSAEILQGNITCTKDVEIQIPTNTNTPLADVVWSKLVAGSNSVVRRMLPKTGGDNTLGSLRDIATSTNITYESGNLSSGIQTGTGKLFFPHIGGISTYFLKTIQTALRPKGYGEIPSSEFNSGGSIFGTVEDPDCNSDSGGSFPDLVDASSGCRLKNTGSSYSSIPALPPTLIAVLESAAETFQVPSSLILGLMYSEGAFNRKNWGWVYTEDNVQAWIRNCAVMPHCDINSSVAEGPLQWIPSSWGEYKNASQVADPGRTPNRCNLFDQIYATAQKASKEANGPPMRNFRAPYDCCFGINFNTGNGGYSTCSDWDLQDVNTAIRQHTGSCLSNPMSGILGSNAGYCTAPCNSPLCETYQQCYQGSSYCTSYYAFAWGVFIHYKNF